MRTPESSMYAAKAEDRSPEIVAVKVLPDSDRHTKFRRSKNKSVRFSESIRLGAVSDRAKCDILSLSCTSCQTPR